MSIPVLFACLLLVFPGMIALAWIGHQAHKSGVRALETIVCGTVWAAIVFAAVIGAEGAASARRAEFRAGLQSVARQFALRAERMRHDLVPSDASPDDPRLARIIEAEKRWMSEHASAASVYTLRRNRAGSYLFVAAAEADLDHDGKIEGDRELRIDPGTVYEEKPPEFETALQQGHGFSDKPEADPWGVWVTAAEALHAPDGRVEAVLGVDFPAQEWATLQDRARFPALLLGTAVTWLFLGSWSMTLRLRKERAAAGARACELARERSLLEQMVENETRLSEESLHVDPSAA